MATPARLREPLVSGAVFEHHPRFARPDGIFWFHEFRAAWGKNVSYARMRPHIEGGDVLVLREDLLAIGYSERTEETTIERLSEALKKAGSAVRHIIVMAIPHERSYMHLDTLFTQASEGECLCYAPMVLAGGAEEADVYSVDLTHDEITWTPRERLPLGPEEARPRPRADPLRGQRPDRRAARAVDRRGERLRRRARNHRLLRPERADGRRARPARLRDRPRRRPPPRPPRDRPAGGPQVRHPALDDRAGPGARRPALHDDAPREGAAPLRPIAASRAPSVPPRSSSPRRSPAAAARRRRAPPPRRESGGDGLRLRCRASRCAPSRTRGRAVVALLPREAPR